MKKPRDPNAIDYSLLAHPKDAPIRLHGHELSMLRLKCFQRDKSRCCECRQSVSDALPKWHPKKAHMAHIQSRGANGADVLENVRTLCNECHRAEHAGQLTGETA